MFKLVRKITCTIVQWKLSQAIDNDQVLNASLSHHLSTCPDCQAFYRLACKTDNPLTEEARSNTGSELPTELTNRIMQSIEQENRTTGIAMQQVNHYPRVDWRELSIRLAAASVGIVLLASAFFYWGQQRNTSQTIETYTYEDVKDMVLSEYGIDGIPLDQAGEYAYLVDQPYQNELDDLVAAADSATDHVIDCVDGLVGFTMNWTVE